MKTVLFFLTGFLLFSSIQVNAQNATTSANTTLSGHVTDAKTNEPLANATVYVHEARVTVITDKDGGYRIQRLTAGKFLVEVTFAGYSTGIETVTVNGDAQKDFSLSPTIVENAGVTVTGVAGASQIKKTPVPVSIVNKQGLLKQSSTNIIDALTKIPGVSQISTGPAISKPTIRGLGYNRLVVINDGVRQEGQQWGDEHGIEVDEYGVSRAEVLKGPASIMYGSDALAGVVNFISVVPAPQGTIRGNVFGNYQSNNRMRGLHADISGNNNGFIWGLNGSFKAAADYKNKYDDYVFNSKFREKNFAGYIGLQKKWGFSHLIVSNFDQEPGLIEGERDETTGQFLKPVNDNGAAEEAIATDADFKSTHPYIPRQHIQHFKITTDNSFNIGKDRLTFNLGYQRNQRQEFGNVLEPDEKELYFDLNTINYNLQYHFAEKNNWKTSVGINGMQQTNKNKGEEQLIPEYDLFDIGGFVYTQKAIGKLTLSGGLRFDNRSLNSKELEADGETKFAGFKKDFSNVSGSAGLSYEVSDKTTLKLNVARGFRAPSIPELASNGAHEGTNRYEYGNNNLKSEQSLQVDAGLDWNTEHVSLEATLFYNNVNNFIYYRKLSAAGGGDSLIVDGPDEFFAFQYDQRDAHLYGAELSLDIHPHPLDWLHFENTFSYVRGVLNEAEDGSKNLPFIPAARLINELRADFLKKGKTLRNLYAKAELDNTFAQNDPYTGYNTETATKGYSLFNLGLGGEIVSKNKTLFSVYLALNNVTDVAWQSHLSRLKYTAENAVTGRTGVYNMGRNFSVKLNVPLNF